MPLQTELRCPVGPRRLLAIYRSAGRRPTYTDGQIEFACTDCARSLRRSGQDVARVLHRFNVLGECVQTIRVARDESASGR